MTKVFQGDPNEKVTAFMLLSFSESALAEEIKSLEVQHISIGSGTDNQAKKVILAILGQSLANGEIASFTAKNWGIEGESTSCIQFKDTGSFAKISKLVEKVANTSNLINLKSKESCK